MQKSSNMHNPVIRVTASNGRVRDYSLFKNEITIGRNKDNDIVLSDHTVSRYHARIMKTKEGFLLTDLGSFNGIKVNEKSIQSTLLQHGDELKIGLARMAFLTQEENVPSLSDSLVITTETDFEKGRQRVVESSPEEPVQMDSQSLLAALESPIKPRRTEPSSPPGEGPPPYRIRAELTDLERSNKVLFVLYEISRQLNSIPDFHDLLKKIMDLIFMVVDADYGYLILTADEKTDELIPVVVKSKHDRGQDRKSLKASRTIIQRVIKDKVALLTSNAMADSRLDHAKSLFIQQIRSAMCVPLWKKDKIIGVIQLESVRLDNQFDQNDLELLKAIGTQMAMVIEQASL
ncbi:MAG: FHA domain-containing protein, partial [Deltaproteobacteria bacterium]|nr:FHA domain-containing protein [Deltaproteobacteria bacterium]